jgi:glucokinase
VLVDALDLVSQLDNWATAQDIAIGAVGVGVCELVDLDGNINSGHTVKWSGLSVRARFSDFAPATVDADVRTPAFAEARYGAGKALSTFIYVTVGTGISYCLVQDGKPYTGTHGNALIFANSPLTTVCTKCGTILKPILEEFASGPALVRRYKQVLSAHRVQNKDAQSIRRTEEVLAAMNNGDPHAIEVVDSAAHALGVSVAWLVNVLDPEAIVVGGGLGTAGGRYWEKFVASTREHIWSNASKDVPILKAMLGIDSGFIGAAAMALDNLPLVKDC